MVVGSDLILIRDTPVSAMKRWSGPLRLMSVWHGTGHFFGPSQTYAFKCYIADSYEGATIASESTAFGK